MQQFKKQSNQFSAKNAKRSTNLTLYLPLHALIIIIFPLTSPDIHTDLGFPQCSLKIFISQYSQFKENALNLI